MDQSEGGRMKHYIVADTMKHAALFARAQGWTLDEHRSIVSTVHLRGLCDVTIYLMHGNYKPFQYELLEEIKQLVKLGRIQVAIVKEHEHDAQHPSEPSFEIRGPERTAEAKVQPHRPLQIRMVF